MKRSVVTIFLLLLFSIRIGLVGSEKLSEKRPHYWTGYLSTLDFDQSELWCSTLKGNIPSFDSQSELNSLYDDMVKENIDLPFFGLGKVPFQDASNANKKIGDQFVRYVVHPRNRTIARYNSQKASMLCFLGPESPAIPIFSQGQPSKSHQPRLHPVMGLILFTSLLTIFEMIRLDN